MKKIIISQRQLSRLNEENTVNISANAKDNSLSSFTTAATNPTTISDIQKAKVAGDVNLVLNGPNTNDEQPTQVVNVAAGDTVQNALATQGNDELIRNGSAVKLSGDGIGESYVFTKKSLKEARLAKIRKDGTTYSKKDLTNKILNTF
jgi:hypothetical protein